MSARQRYSGLPLTASCFEPSELVTVENMAAERPAPYVGVPVTSSGGHACAHAPVQLALPGVVSLSQTYNVMPLESTSTFLPSALGLFTAASATVVPPVAALEAAVVPGAAVVAGAAVVPGAAVVGDDAP